MNPILLCLFLCISFSPFFRAAYSVEEEEEVRRSLVSFLSKLTDNSSQPQIDRSFNWNLTSDPCKDNWKGVVCDRTNTSVRRLLLSNHNFAGTFDAAVICNVQNLTSSLLHIGLDGNDIGGQIPAEIANCKQLIHLHLSGNRFSGSLPDSLPMLSNLKRLDISFNDLSGNLPDISRISGLTMFLAQYNQLTGEIPDFDFSNFDQFNISFNNFTGSVPADHGWLTETSLMGNPQLCGAPLPKNCASSSGDKKSSEDQILMYSGYVLVGTVFVACVVFRICRKKKKEEKVDLKNKVGSFDESMTNPSVVSTEYKTGASKSKISVHSAENSTLVSSSLIVLTSPEVNGLKFKDLLGAPAELMGRGKHGSLYKVNLENGKNLAVKRIKDWTISSNDFKERMQRLDQVKHPNVLSALAFYSSTNEKLLVYEYQKYGSLFMLLHGTKTGRGFDWPSRLGFAASIAEALAFMHQEHRDYGIAHGNLKSSNILLNDKMEPCISEYGLMPMHSKESSSKTTHFKADVHGLGVILLELLTGRLVQNNGVDLTTWVNSVVREEWTAEVFEKSLVSEGANEERMVNLLQVAVKCVNPSPEARPNASQVATMINTIKEEEEEEERSQVYEDRSIVFEP
ncbi:putative serine-threonine protein kinase plant-type [Tripterygium wilfordii]|uniref:Putative serine-threonine protein kinase plant-type n=1 Tax=Tripterygium wilfordii TaxID=458696 RepID=A0A7J7CZU5_TRIWF|nr:probable inactive receptor kinase At2g26730 [Tripterygium wilfordii]KAF5739635.1 putative serine-threonine protein kinase plant-type [Tripterygium wilfordii]